MSKNSDKRRERIRQYLQGGSAKSKSDVDEKGEAAPETPVKPPSSKGRVAVILLACLLGSVTVTYVVFKFFIIANVSDELVGTWQVSEGPLRGAILEIRDDGAVIATLMVKGKKEVTKQSAKVEGKKLILVSKDPDTKKTDTVIQTIVSLTDDELVLRDEDNRTYRMKRVHKQHH